MRSATRAVHPGLVGRLAWISIQPSRYVEGVVLSAPQQAGERLPQNGGFVGCRVGGAKIGVELVRLLATPGR